MNDEISPRLQRLESVIQNNLEAIVNSQFEVGAALIEIRDEQLYLEAFDTFEAYCRERWGMSRPRAYQLIAAAETANHLSTVVDIKPRKESQVRALAGLNPGEQRKIWQRAVKNANGKEPTARQVAAARDDMMTEIEVKLEPSIKEPPVKKRIAEAAERIFMESQREMRRFNKEGQERFKAALLSTLNEKLVPEKPLTSREAMRHLKESIASYVPEK